MNNTYTQEQFSSGKGYMSYQDFVAFANKIGIGQTIWIAKYYGVSLNTVRDFVRAYMKK